MFTYIHRSRDINYFKIWILLSFYLTLCCDIFPWDSRYFKYMICNSYMIHNAIDHNELLLYFGPLILFLNIYYYEGMFQ